MSALRPTLQDADPSEGKWSPPYSTAYLMIYNAIRDRAGLLHGKLRNNQGATCAIGSYFDAEPHCVLKTDIVDEIAAINDSCPLATARIRKIRVMRFLRSKLKFYGIKP